MVIKQKRFIAGAVCPQCKAMDSIMLYIENDVEQLECIKCGYHKSQADEEPESTIPNNESVIGVFKPE